jgi:hypothetical protein
MHNADRNRTPLEFFELDRHFACREGTRNLIGEDARVPTDFPPRQASRTGMASKRSIRFQQMAV